MVVRPAQSSRSVAWTLTYSGVLSQKIFGAVRSVVRRSWQKTTEKTTAMTKNRQITIIFRFLI